MNERAKLIKQAMALELAKEGKTIMDLERGLSKTALMGLADISKFVEIAKGLLSGTGAAVTGAGLAAGGLGYGMYLNNEDSSKQIAKKMQEKRQYDEAAKALQDRMNNPIVM